MQTFYKILLIGLSYRLFIFILLIFFPFNHEIFGSLSPLSFHSFADLDFYYNFGEKKFDILNFLSTYKNIFLFNFLSIENRFPGPLFPLILSMTFYDKNFTLILSLLIFSSEIIAYIIWSSKKFIKNNLAFLFFSLMPIPLYFGFMHSTDVIFYLLFTFLYFEIIGKKRFKVICIIFLLIIALRPNSTLVVLATLIYFYLNKENFYILLTTIIFLIISVIYYSPYFFYEMELLNNSSAENYDNYDYNFILVNSFIYIKKIFFLLGFIPSESGNIYFYLLRCLCGLIFGIGLLNLLYKRDSKIDLVFVIFFVFGTATLFFPAYRYILPITPILIFYFCNLIFKKFIF